MSPTTPARTVAASTIQKRWPTQPVTHSSRPTTRPTALKPRMQPVSFHEDVRCKQMHGSPSLTGSGLLRTSVRSKWLERILKGNRCVKAAGES